MKATIYKYLEFYHNCTPISNRYWE
jgi:hypothetical protein